MNRAYFIWLALLAIVAFFYFYAKLQPTVINYPPKNRVIVAFGDSLVQGYGSSYGKDFVAQLSAKLRYPIVNLGVSGETSANGLRRVADVIARDPGVVIVLFGGNDYLRQVPKSETFENLRQIITRLQSSGSMVVLLGVRGGLVRDAYEDDFEKVVKETRVIYIPDVLNGLIGDSRYMSDAIHPNDTGYARIAERVYKEISGYME